MENGMRSLHIQMPMLDNFSSERLITRERSHGKEMYGLDSKYLERHALRDPSQHRYDDQRSVKCDCDERFGNQHSQGTFKGKPT